MSKGKLYLVATPIGNLGDMTYRAVETLKSVDAIAAEDTRNTIKLLNHFDIKKPMISYHEHNKRARGEELLSGLLDGKSYALVSDAGMPAISDPGEDLVSLCLDAGVEINVIPGASAAISAIAASGMGGGRFCFEGFLSVSNRRRKEHLSSLKQETRAMIFYEAPHKLSATLQDMAEAFGEDRRIVLARELTKKYEEIARMTIGDAIKKYEDLKPLGEFVLVIEGITGETSEEDAANLKQKAQELILRLTQQGMTNRDILAVVCKETGLKRNEVYEMILEK